MAKTLAGVLAVSIAALLFAGCNRPIDTSGIDESKQSTISSTDKSERNTCEELVIAVNASQAGWTNFKNIDAVRMTCTRNHFVSTANRVRTAYPGGFFSKNQPKEWLSFICGGEVAPGSGYKNSGFLVCR